MSIPYTIKRWNDWFLTNEYIYYRNKVNALYATDKQFVCTVDNLIQTFFDRLKNRNYKFIIEPENHTRDIDKGHYTCRKIVYEFFRSYMTHLLAGIIKTRY